MLNGNKDLVLSNGIRFGKKSFPNYNSLQFLNIKENNQNI